MTSGCLMAITPVLPEEPPGVGPGLPAPQGWEVGSVPACLGGGGSPTRARGSWPLPVFQSSRPQVSGVPCATVGSRRAGASAMTG
eukprot:CAMPEP_0174919138 /NCGR_PEP_ID=MMETSP1355-20121228/3499_1 /TAXON_ID=464990 /ORGANISM="Hemiselmis tepida, Strain CCMP443" /LENGTH=84 /DNA_ID=CAMNT_0016164351 /DNA_START=68 /DNA_END=323 /DNA_ORIENTATION=-